MGRRGWINRETVRKISEPIPLVEIADDRRVLIEHHHGVSSYTSEQVSVCVKYGQISILGEQLCIARMTREQLVICGTIAEVKLRKAGGKHGR